MAHKGHGRRPEPDIAATFVNKHLFRGNPRLLVGALPWAFGVLVLKSVAHEIGAEWLNLSPLLAGGPAGAGGFPRCPPPRAPRGGGVHPRLPPQRHRR